VARGIPVRTIASVVLAAGAVGRVAVVSSEYRDSSHSTLLSVATGWTTLLLVFFTVKARSSGVRR
jgi:predicted membrane channel-forming protein YqfA (hemolysin III family)